MGRTKELRDLGKRFAKALISAERQIGTKDAVSGQAIIAQALVLAFRRIEMPEDPDLRRAHTIWAARPKGATAEEDIATAVATLIVMMPKSGSKEQTQGFLDDLWDWLTGPGDGPGGGTAPGGAKPVKPDCGRAQREWRDKMDAVDRASAELDACRDAAPGGVDTGTGVLPPPETDSPVPVPPVDPCLEEFQKLQRVLQEKSEAFRRMLAACE